MSIVSFHNVQLNIAGNQLLDHADWQIKAHDRIALVGINGAGKSTLLKLLQGYHQPDSGQINILSGLRIASLTQEVPITEDENVYHFLVKDLGEVGEVIARYRHLTEKGDMHELAVCQQRMDQLHAWDKLPLIDTMATRLGINTQLQMQQLSGGMKRRVLLAAALIVEPDLLLLDEPTNHLDIDSIEWLESYLKNFKGAVLVVTHDRAFLGQVADKIVEIDRGKLFTYYCDYPTYLQRREGVRESEQRQNDLFDKKLAEEEVWIRTGIKARRTRNEGRVRALKAMREEYKARRSQLSTVKNINLDVKRSGALVIDAEQVNYGIEGKKLLQDFSLLLMRGDKLGIIGPNGCGKTTLARLLLGELQPDSGTIKLGTSLSVAYFDQLRRQLHEDKTVMYNVAEGADYVTINGKSKHVASYLADFLFSSERFNQPVSVLSGGERNRLLLAKLLAKPVNFLVMDEPTNDLDMETLELLEEMLANYPGTLILISHDREFINQVVTSTLVYEGDGCFNEYVGGYDEYIAYKKSRQQHQRISEDKKTVIAKRTTSQKLSFNEQRELTALPQQIEQLEEKIALQQQQLANPEFYQREAHEIATFNKQLMDDEAQLNQFYARWEALEDRR